jgi:hypothetical protein
LAIGGAPARAAEVDPPDDRGADGLRVDLERIVASEESGGWLSDRTHLEAMRPTVLQSVCRASASARGVLAARLEAEVDAAGDPRALWNAAGGRLTSDVERALHVRRVRDALRSASGAEDCPFWLAPERGFDGRQLDRHRFTLSLETGALLQLRAAEQTSFGLAPSIRVLPGYGLGRVTLLTGVELSGGPMTNGGAASSLTLHYFPVVPLIVRYTDTNGWHYDLESGLVSTFQGESAALSYGFRAGAGLGLMGLRTRYFIPWIGAAVFYEHTFANDARPAASYVRGGLRVGLVYLP